MSRIEISKEALGHNLSKISDIVPLDKIYAVLKDNAYGHGLRLFGLLCAQFGIKHAIVRDSKEALEIDDLFESILCLAETSHFEVPNNVHFAVNSTDIIKKIPKKSKVHLKVDTGMHRSGIDESVLVDALRAINSQDLELCGVFSHLRSADELCSDSFWQEKNFIRIRGVVLDFCREHSIKTPKFHLQNSAGLFRSGSLGRFDMARVGIALYGYLDMPSAVGSPDLKPVMSLWADKISTRVVEKGQKIGYGGVGSVQTRENISSYDIGYADGFPRSSVDADYVLPSGLRLIGRVSMDNICVNSDANSVCVFNDVRALAKRYSTITYEITTRLSRNIERIVV